MKPLAASLAVAALGIALQAQSAPPSAPPDGIPAPVIMIDPRAYLSPSPAPRPRTTKSPHRGATPRPRRTPVRRRPLTAPTPELFERYDTVPPASPRPSTRTRNA